jgi:hypothetical protein
MNSQANPYAKRYYTLEETLNRLKEAGIDLDTIDDVLMIAREDHGENRLEIKLLCDEPITLVKPCHTKIIKLKLPVDFDRQYWLDNYLSPSHIDHFISEIESSNWLVTQKIHYSELKGIAVNTEDDFLIDAYQPTESNLLVTPVALDVSYDGLHVRPYESSWLRNTKHQKIQTEYLAAIMTNGTLYYVASKRKTNRILESYKLVESNNCYTLAKHNCEGQPRENNWHSLECKTIQELIKNKSFVVTGKALHAYVEKNGTTSKAKPQPLKLTGEKIDNKRLTSLQKFINELKVSAKQKKINFDPFEMRCTKGMLLEALKRWEKNRVSVKKDRVWETENFPKKTWESEKRKDICRTLSHGGNPDVNYLKKLF